MKILIKWQLLTLLLANAITLSACSNSNAKNQPEANEKVLKSETNSQPTTPGKSTVQLELDKAKKAGKAVFVVVTGNGTTDTDKATTIAKGANNIYKNSVIIQMNRDDAANSELVSQWRLSGAPLPLILAISPKGYPTGGFILAQATAENIAALVPTPKLDNIYDAINNGKSVFLVASKKSYTDKAQILENCNSAIKQLQNKAIIVDVDLDDKNEAAFIKQLNLKNTPNTTVAIVINAYGQTTGSFEGKAQASELVLAANKVIRSSGCCPGGSSASCGPQK